MSTSVRNMVRGECLAPGLNLFSATFFVKRGQQLELTLLCLESHGKNVTARLGGPLLHRCV